MGGARVLTVPPWERLPCKLFLLLLIHVKCHFFYEMIDPLSSHKGNVSSHSRPVFESIPWWPEDRVLVEKKHTIIRSEQVSLLGMNFLLFFFSVRHIENKPKVIRIQNENL